MEAEPFDDPRSVLISATSLDLLVQAASLLARDELTFDAIEEAESALERYK